jgi:hypothetical protein
MNILLAIIKRRDSPQQLVRRAHVVLLTAEQPTHTVSVDEKTGVQVLERAAPDLSMKPGHAQKPWQNHSDGLSPEHHSNNN